MHFKCHILSVFVLLAISSGGLVNGQCIDGCMPETIDLYPFDSTAGILTFDVPLDDCVPVDGAVTRTCSGYSTGAATFTCTANATWSPYICTCFGISSCPPPEVPDHGFVVGDSYDLFETIEYGCNDTYTSVGADSAQCTPTGEWSQPPPSCQAPCTLPDVYGPVDIIPTISLYMNGEVVQFSCTPGTETVLEGADAATCRDGTWEPAPPGCYFDCSVPAITMATYTGGQNPGDVAAHKDSVAYMCENGTSTANNWTRSSEGVTECFDGEWSVNPVGCQQDCVISDLLLSENAYIAPRPTYFHDDVLPIECSDGVSSDPNATAECQDGAWNAGFTECVVPENCQDPGSPANGYAEGSFNHGEDVSFYCNVSYSLVGDALIECFDGIWSGGVPACLADCSEPGAFENGDVIGSEFGHGANVSFVCNDNLTLVGDLVITCNDGTWSGEVPMCTGAPITECPEPVSPENGFWVGENFSDGSVVTFECNIDFDLVGEQSITCIAGLWSGDAPACLESGGDNETVSAELECRSDEIYVRMDASILTMLAGDTISFEGYPNCTGVLEQGYLVFRSGFDECGTVNQMEGEIDVYHNRIVNGANTGALISRDLTVSFPITCYYQRVHKLEYGYAVSGSSQLIQQQLVDVGDYNVAFDLSLYTDASFTERVDPQGADIPVNQRAYFAVEIYPDTEKVAIDSCWTTPSNNSDDERRYNLITDRCWKEQTVERYDLGRRDIAAFSLSSFTYLDGNQVFLYCTVSMCTSGESNLECAPCSLSRRRRGALVGARSPGMKDVSVGPVQFVEVVDDDQHDTNLASDDDSMAGQDHGAFIATVVVMAAVIIGLVVLVVVLVKKNRNYSAISI